MPNILRTKQRIKSYQETVSLLRRKIRKLEQSMQGDLKETESVEEGEIVEQPERRKKRAPPEDKEAPAALAVEHLEKKAKHNMPELLKTFFTTIDTAETSAQQSFLSQLLPFLTNALKYIILHDVVLFARQLEKYEVFYATLFPNGFEKDSSEVAQAFMSIYAFLTGEESEEDLKAKTVKLLHKSVGCSVIAGDQIAQPAFDAATAIKLYCKVLDWNWTYNELIRDHLFVELKQTERPFAVYVLSLLYAEWNRSLVSHKSLEFLIQILDKVAGIGSGENITRSPYCLESQLASSLMLRQFRPGASLKWHRKRIEEATAAEKELIDSAWKIVLF